MAMMLKDRYNLKTLRCWIGYAKSANSDNDTESFGAQRVLRTQLYAGKQPVGDYRDTPFHQLGLNSDGSPPHKSCLPQIAETAIADQLRAAEDGDPAAVWLHIKRDSYSLALLPWEEMAAQAIETPVLRIGNFIDDPYKPVAAPRIAICASQPIGDGPYQLGDFVFALLAVMAEAAHATGVTPKISIFADSQWLPTIQNRSWPSGLTDVEIVAPPDNPSSGASGPNSSGTDSGRSSAWLAWITAHYKETTVDLVHFITPGWFADNHGAIALADTPTSNVGGGEFVGAAELAGFFDRIGCSAMAFSSPNMPQWEWGQRMLAFELSWLRPGPVMVFEHDVPHYQSLGAAYRLLFGFGSSAVISEAYNPHPAQLTCHPQLLAPAGFSTNETVRGAIFAEPAPTDLLSRQVDLAIAQLQPTRELSMAEKWEAAGAAAALNFVKSLG